MGYVILCEYSYYNEVFCILQEKKGSVAHLFNKKQEKVSESNTILLSPLFSIFPLRYINNS